MASLRYSVPGHPTYFTEQAFSWAFALWYAGTDPGRHVEIDNRISEIWPKNKENRLVYSKPAIRNLLREMWDQLVPKYLNMPCQQWWLDRCTARLEKAGTGITRDTFYSLFLSEDEIYRIACCITHFNSKNLTKLLTAATKKELLPTDIVQEFFLIINDESTSDPNFEIKRTDFAYAFPLWFAANSAID